MFRSSTWTAAGERTNTPLAKDAVLVSCTYPDLETVQTQNVLNANTGWAFILPPLCVGSYGPSTHVCCYSSREGKGAEHANDMSEYYKLYRAFGLEMQVDDYEQNAYDRKDLQFLELHRILLTGQVIWVVNPLGSPCTLENNRQHSRSNRRECKFFTDTSSWMSSCVMHGDSGTSMPYIQLQASFWLLLTCAVFLQIVIDLAFLVQELGGNDSAKLKSLAATRTNQLPWK